MLLITRALFQLIDFRLKDTLPLYQRHFAKQKQSTYNNYEAPFSPVEKKERVIDCGNCE
jgi:hypothetical protein